jgi:quercetin dioxygenase-like cupin family protein
MKTVGLSETQQTISVPLVLSPSDIDRRPWLPVPGCSGVRAKELSQSSDCTHALITIEPGASTPGQPHPSACHHIWVLAGHARIAGRTVMAGSFAYIPAGVAHPITADGVVPCVLLQAHHPVDDAG